MRSLRRRNRHRRGVQRVAETFSAIFISSTQEEQQRENGDGRRMLKLQALQYEEIRRHGEETYPDECCGILLGVSNGDERRVRAILRCENACTESPQNRYDIDVREVIGAQRHARDEGLEIVGFYHSHPDHPARWSQTDLREAHWIGCSYVITSVTGGKASETNSFALSGTREEDKAFVEEEVVVE